MRQIGSEKEKERAREGKRERVREIHRGRTDACTRALAVNVYHSVS